MSFHVPLVLDHFSRTLVAFAVFRKEPSAQDVCGLLERAVASAGASPRYLISDQGSQFQGEYRDWCRAHGVNPRFGAVGNHGSIAVIERFILSLKDEFLRRIFIHLRVSQIEVAIERYCRVLGTEGLGWEGE